MWRALGNANTPKRRAMSNEFSDDPDHAYLAALR
jgi:hypothetical protein